MTTFVPVLPETAPFSTAQKAWLNGFFAGLFSRAANSGAVTQSPEQSLQPLTILYASQTGTAERLAKKAAKAAGKRGFAPTLLDISQESLEKLSAENAVLLLTSTYGDGEAPDSAKALHNALSKAAGTPLSKLHFSVCGLGDSNYAKFCQAGKDFDLFLEKLGGKRISARIDCDVGQEEKFTAWLDAALGEFGSAANRPATAPEAAEEDDEAHKSFEARLLSVTRLNAADSGKEVNHVCFSLKESGLSYKAGDALSVTPDNSPTRVSEILSALGCDGEEAVLVNKDPVSLRKALTSSFDLGKPSAELLSLLGLPSGTAPHHVIDALLAAPGAKPSPAAFLGALKKLQPRLYSISSSPKAHVDEVHLTVGAVRYEHSGRKREGVCSIFLAERALSAAKVTISVHENNAFRLPERSDTPVIMIGPGTGIAPFRAFLHERIASGASGPNWLFFGDQRASSDFLYKEELLPLEQAGRLKLSLAWSRDQAEKIYVQHRILEQAAELWSWLEQGAHLYVCGDASRMAKDVEAALLKVLETAGSLPPEDALAYVNTLKANRRYQRDVY